MHVNHLPAAQFILFRDYDDSSDEEIDLNYGKVDKKKITELTEEVTNFDLLHSEEINELTLAYQVLTANPSSNKKEIKEKDAALTCLKEIQAALIDQLDEAKAWQSDNPIFIMASSIWRVF